MVDCWVYLVFNKHGFVRARKTPCYLEKNERVLKLKVNIDPKIFDDIQFEHEITFSSQINDHEIDLLEEEIHKLRKIEKRSETKNA